MKSLAVVGVVLAVLVAGASRAGGAPAAASQHAIVVTGQGSVTARPDRAQLSFGVSTDAKSASAAVRANAAEMTRVIAPLKGQGISAADLRTDLVSLAPRYSQNGESVVGYGVTNSVSATVRDLAKIGAIIDAAVDAGANQVSGPDLVRSSATALYRIALRAAIADARGKARTIAAASGLHIRRITDVSESSAAPAPTPLTAKATADASTPVETGSTLVEATVTVTFAVG